MSKFKAESTDDETCSFGGLSLYQGIRKPFSLIRNTCVNEATSSTFHYSEWREEGNAFETKKHLQEDKNIIGSMLFFDNVKIIKHQIPDSEENQVWYSDSNTASVVIYSLEDFVHFSVSISVAITECSSDIYRNHKNDVTFKRKLSCHVIHLMHQGPPFGALDVGLLAPELEDGDQIEVTATGRFMGEFQSGDFHPCN